MDAAGLAQPGGGGEGEEREAEALNTLLLFVCKDGNGQGLLCFALAEGQEAQLGKVVQPGGGVATVALGKIKDGGGAAGVAGAQEGDFGESGALGDGLFFLGKGDGGRGGCGF